jgi:hypothetical protein
MAKFKKKYTTEQVKDIFAESDCELLDEYQDMLTPMNYKCACGSLSKIRLFSFLKGSRCKECGRKKMSQSRKLSFDVVKEKFEEVGYQVLSTEYIDNKTPINYICDRGHEGSNSYANFSKGRRCKQCWVEDNSGANHCNYNPDREQVKENDKFRRLCRSLVRRVLKAIDKDKLKKSKELLGYSHKDLRDHLYDHKNLENMGDEKWVVDHIFPIKAFLDYGIEDISLINSLDNLQPLEEKENLVKNDKYSKEEFESYLENKGVIDVD